MWLNMDNVKLPRLTNFESESMKKFIEYKQYVHENGTIYFLGAAWGHLWQRRSRTLRDCWIKAEFIMIKFRQFEQKMEMQK